MINSVTFLSLFLIAELVGLWLAYRLGHDNGWLAGWEGRRGLEQRGVFDSETRREV